MRSLYVHVKVCVQFRGVHGMFGGGGAYIRKGGYVYMCEFENI